jgi:hypothetical protein
MHSVVGSIIDDSFLLHGDLRRANHARVTRSNRCYGSRCRSHRRNGRLKHNRLSFGFGFRFRL